MLDKSEYSLALTLFVVDSYSLSCLLGFSTSQLQRFALRAAPRELNVEIGFKCFIIRGNSDYIANPTCIETT